MIQRLSFKGLSILSLVWFGLFFCDILFAGGGDPGFEYRRKVFYVEPGLMFWTLITFGLLLVILKTLAWGPIVNGLKNREERIRNDLERAERAWQEAEAKAEALAKRLEEAKAEALALLEEGRADALKLRNQILAEAETEARLVRERSKNEIELATKQALQQIWEQTADLAIQVASKILQKELSAQAHQDLVKECIEDYQQLHS